MWSLFKLKDPRLLFSVHGLIVVTPIFQLALVGLQLRLSYFLLGMIYANFMEYYNHLVNFHTIPHLISQRAYFVMHGHHHKYPDRNPITPLPQTLFLYVVSDILFRLIFPENHSHVLAGGAFGFLIFEASHVFIHKVEREEWKAAWLRPMIDYHLTHHIDPKRAYGFTSPFWDWCFGNLPSRERYQWPIVPLPFPIIPFLLAKSLFRGVVQPRRRISAAAKDAANQKTAATPTSTWAA